MPPREREAHEPAGFVKNPQRWVMVPAHAKVRIPGLFKRDDILTKGAHTFAPIKKHIKGGQANEDFYAEFGDELFTRTPQGMQPTPYAQQLADDLNG